MFFLYTFSNFFLTRFQTIQFLNLIPLQHRVRQTIASGTPLLMQVQRRFDNLFFVPQVKTFSSGVHSACTVTEYK